MSQIDISTFKNELNELNNRYHKLLIVCGADRNEAFGKIIEDLNIPTVNLNLELSRALLEIPISRRSRKTGEIVERLIWDCQSDIIYFDHIEFLFNPDLRQDPVKLLMNLSRNKTLIISWPGEYKKGVLTYAEFGHAEYRTYSQVEAGIISISD